jgi:hypothetical protein
MAASIHWHEIDPRLFSKTMATGAREPTPTANTENHQPKLLIVREAGFQLADVGCLNNLPVFNSTQSSTRDSHEGRFCREEGLPP